MLGVQHRHKVSASGAWQNSADQYHFFGCSGILIYLVECIDHCIMCKVTGWQMTAGSGSIVAILVRCRHCDKNPVTVLYHFLCRANLHRVAGARVNIVPANFMMLGKYFSTVKTQFT